MIRVYGGGWDSTREDVIRWIDSGLAPDGIFSSVEEARANAYHVVCPAPDEYIYFVFEDGHIEEFLEW